VTTPSILESPPQKINALQDVGVGSFTSINTPATTENPASYETPAEDKDLTALRAYILDNGFTVSAVAFHIVVLCSQPMVTPSTTDWDFADRQHIPELVYVLLNKCGYLEGIWPSLKIVMGSNKANSAWTAGIATTIAFFDTIRVLPTLKELKK